MNLFLPNESGEEFVKRIFRIYKNDMKNNIDYILCWELYYLLKI